MKYLIITAIASVLLWISGPDTSTEQDVRNLAISNDSLLAIWNAHIGEIKEDLGERVQLPSDSVFSNMQIGMFGAMPAERLLNIMKMGFSRALGVGCDHCHNTKDWASDEVVAKQSARDMWTMTHKINNQMLKEIRGLEDKRTFVNCTTCHRGEITPATKMDQ